MEENKGIFSSSSIHMFGLVITIVKSSAATVFLHFFLNSNDVKQKRTYLLHMWNGKSLSISVEYLWKQLRLED